MAALPSRTAHRRSAKSRRTYREPDSDSDIEHESLPVIARPTRSSRRIQTYRESSTSDNTDSSLSTSASDAASISQNLSSTPIGSTNLHSNLRRSQRTKSRGTRRRLVSVSVTLNSYKRRKISHRSRAEDTVLKEKPDEVLLMPVNKHAPPWQMLEYHILFKIMQYAAYPLYSSASRSRPSIGWLVGVSRLCKSFYDAGIAALLWEPPLLPHSRARGLISVLSQDQDRLAINHRTKIRILNIEVKNRLLKNKGVTIEDLLKYTPLVSHLRIFHSHDEMIGKAIWAEPSVSHVKWSYRDLVEVLIENNIRLKSFEWNGRFQDTVGSMQFAHGQSCMSEIRALSIVNLNFGEKHEDERIRARDNVIVALSLLRNLNELEFRNCTILDPSSMTQLPLGLKCLKIANCLSITSEGIASYLTLGGSSIHTLHLEGNQVMNLAFMPNLSELCPCLESLYIDLSYEDGSSYRDRNPLYDELLPNGPPTWPSTLASIVVGPLRSLDVSDAEDFYSSLIEAAGNLPYLRILSIRTILNDASWRDRASLRTKWRPLFEKVFSANKTYTPTISRPEPEEREDSARKSARLKEQEDSSSSEGSDGVDESIVKLLTLPRQNKCEMVEFDLSDQRPTQEQFREDDFLDSEVSGDDEWNGRDVATSRPGYAW